MKPAATLALGALVLFTVFDASAASPPRGGTDSVATARTALEKARADLAQAVQRIEKDPPSTADLDAAHVAVGALKDAIDAGAGHEPNDLDYAKSALAARKELRTQREYVDQRRAKVHIHNHRRTIDAAVAELTTRAKKVEGKDPSAKDFEDARAAVAALKKAVDEGRQFVAQDAKYASYVAECDSTVAKHENAIDERWLRQSADKHRAIVEQSRKALADAMAALAKGGTDAQFEGADRALSALSKRLEEGKALESKDAKYRADAERGRAEVEQSRKKIDVLWSEKGLAKLKGEIEPAHQDLAAAGRAVRGKRPTADQVAEARTASIVVRKLLEKYEPQAARSEGFRQYVNEVQKTLVDVEVELQKGTLDSARVDVIQALRHIERRAPTDEHFQEVNTAVVILEKTLEAAHKKHADMLKPVADARTVLREARATIAKRRFEVDVQRQRAKVEEAKKTAIAAVRQIQPADVGPDKLQAADDSVKALREVLDEGAAFARRDGDYSQYARDVKERIKDLSERIAARKLALSASEGRSALDDAVSSASAKVDAATRPQAAEPELDTAAKAVETVAQTLESRVALERKDRGYAAQAAKGRKELERLREGLDFAKQARALRRKTVEAYSAGAAVANSAASARELHAQKAQYEKAIGHFRTCEGEGSSMVEVNAALARVPVIVDGNPSPAKEVIAMCAQRVEATEQVVAQVVALIRFDEAKKFFEKGKGLLAQAKKGEAVSQFDECIATGKILQVRNPELKDRKFQVGGANLTLTELIEQCINHKKSLRPN